METKIAVVTIIILLMVGVVTMIPVLSQTPFNETPLNNDMRRADYRNGQHSITFQKGLNYVKNGRVYPYDLRIKPISDSNFTHLVSNKVDVLLNTSLNKPYRIKYDNHYAEFILVDGSSETGTIRDNSIEFPNALQNTKIVLDMVKLGIKEKIIMENPSAVWTISTTMRTNLMPDSRPDGSILLLSGELPIFTISSPKAKDANGTAFPVVLSLRASGENFSLETSVTADSGGVNPRFPIEIDPTVTFTGTGTTRDTRISGYPGESHKANFGAAENLVTGFIRDATYNDPQRTLIKFVGITDSIPYNASIDSAYLKLYNYLSQKSAGLSHNVQLYQITEDWLEGNNNGTEGVCSWGIRRA